MGKTKYTAIERPEYHVTAVSLDVLSAIKARPDVHGEIAKQYPITKADIKKQAIRVYDDVSYINSITANVDFTNKYHGKIFTATVDWFSISGEGMVTLHDGGVRLAIYACNITGKKTWFPETACVYYEKGQQVEIRVDVHGYRNVFAIGVTPGHVDVEGWNRIKNQPLAFRCNDDGEAITGLFEK